MTAPMTFNQFLRCWRRFVDKESAGGLPGSQHFLLDEREAETSQRTRKGLDGNDIFAVGAGEKHRRELRPGPPPKAADAKQQEDFSALNIDGFQSASASASVIATPRRSI